MKTYAEDSSVRVALAALAEVDETLVDTRLTYREGDPVLIRVRRRGRRYDITDDGAGVAKAGKPAGWLDATERLAADEGFNVNRRGVIFVPVVAGRDIASLTFRLAETSRAAYLTLLEAPGEPEMIRR